MLKDKIIEWAKTLMVPQETLDNMPLCPFAKKAMANDEVEIVIFDDDSEDSTFFQLMDAILSWEKKENKKLLIFARENINYGSLIYTANEIMITFPDVIVLIGNPNKPTIINGITTTFPDCGLFFIQHKDYLKEATDSLKKTKYYSFWTRQQLDEILNWRENV